MARRGRIPGPARRLRGTRPAAITPVRHRRDSQPSRRPGPRARHRILLVRGMAVDRLPALLRRPAGPVVAATWLAWMRRSTAAGAWAGLWGGLFSGLVFFMGVSVATHERRPARRPLPGRRVSPQRGATPPTYAVGDNLSSAIVMLLALPVFAVAFGSLGAWLATHPSARPVRKAPSPVPALLLRAHSSSPSSWPCSDSTAVVARDRGHSGCVLPWVTGCGGGWPVRPPAGQRSVSPTAARPPRGPEAFSTSEDAEAADSEATWSPSHGRDHVAERRARGPPMARTARPRPAW